LAKGKEQLAKGIQVKSKKSKVQVVGRLLDFD
jgi:hypothetical protein